MIACQTTAKLFKKGNSLILHFSKPNFVCPCTNKLFNTQLEGKTKVFIKTILKDLSGLI